MYSISTINKTFTCPIGRDHSNCLTCIYTITYVSSLIYAGLVNFSEKILRYRLAESLFAQRDLYRCEVIRLAVFFATCKFFHAYFDARNEFISFKKGTPSIQVVKILMNEKCFGKQPLGSAHMTRRDYC